jgi:uncharacterized protein (DUF1800 family)
MRRKNIALLLTLTLASPPLAAKTPAAERQRAVHTLNRLAFGPAPGDVDRVLAIGVDRYINEQLYPEKIADTAVAAKIAAYPALQLSDRALIEKYVAPLMKARQARRKGEEMPERPMQRPNLVALELTAARLDRAIASNRQLNEVMVDFWMNHFNVFAGKGLDRVLIVGYERDTIRPHVWGSFEDLLLATAKSPAMLFYLDNARSIAPPEARATTARRGATRNQGGLNENYARELLELHTLGVDGGYTQKDVTELARVLTGWSIPRKEESGSGFIFRAAVHDRGAKQVLGLPIAAGGGVEEGERLLRYLALHPSTARHIARKLVQKFVNDDAPPALVDRVAARFLATRGDLRETVRAVIASPEFNDQRYYGAKVKTPFEYVVSAIRSTASSTTNSLGLARVLRDLGQPLYFSQPPTGYSELSKDWVNSGALVNRLNFAINLASGQIAGVRTNTRGPEAPAPRAVDALADQLLGVPLSSATRKTIETKLLTTPEPDKRMQLATALILGSPEFQKQ